MIRLYRRSKLINDNHKLSFSFQGQQTKSKHQQLLIVWKFLAHQLLEEVMWPKLYLLQSYDARSDASVLCNWHWMSCFTCNPITSALPLHRSLSPRVCPKAAYLILVHGNCGDEVYRGKSEVWLKKCYMLPTTSQIPFPCTGYELWGTYLTTWLQFLGMLFLKKIGLGFTSSYGINLRVNRPLD